MRAKWTDHIENICAKSNKLGSSLILPALEYTRLIWSGLEAVDAEKLERQQYQAYKIVASAMKYTHNKIHIHHLQKGSPEAHRSVTTVQLLRFILPHLKPLKLVLSEIIPYTCNTRALPTKGKDSKCLVFFSSNNHIALELYVNFLDQNVYENLLNYPKYRQYLVTKSLTCCTLILLCLCLGMDAVG